MKLILNQAEINSAFGCRLEELGLANINKTSIVVTFKSTRGADGSTEAEVDFDFHEPNIKRANCPPVQNVSPEAMASTEETDESTSDDAGGSSDSEASDSDSSSDIANIFNN